MALKDQEIRPDKPVLQKALAGSYPAYEELLNLITGTEYGLVPEWRFYNDGKAWLCKVVHKKKTIFWLSVWDGYFKAGFYFTEKSGAAIFTLDIDPGIKKSFTNAKSVGRLIPLAFIIRESNQLKDLLVVVRYKMKA
ncbi:MAG: DUF3788 family protein [Bacteroidales bacterium]